MLRMLTGFHFLVLLMLRVGLHFRVLLMWLVGVHFVMLLVWPMRIHLVVLRVRLQLVSGGVGQHGLEQVRRLTGLISGRVHEGHSGWSLGMLLLDFWCFPREGDFSPILWLLLKLHLSVWGYLTV